MKIFKVLISFIIVIFAFSYSNAQKIGVIDTNYILSKLPQYTEAQSRLDAQIKGWEDQLQKMQAEYDAKKLLSKMKKFFS
jgi:outer membrane protein